MRNALSVQWQMGQFALGKKPITLTILLVWQSNRDVSYRTKYIKTIALLNCGTIKYSHTFVLISTYLCTCHPLYYKLQTCLQLSGCLGAPRRICNVVLLPTVQQVKRDAEDMTDESDQHALLYCYLAAITHITSSIKDDQHALLASGSNTFHVLNRIRQRGALAPTADLHCWKAAATPPLLAYLLPRHYCYPAVPVAVLLASKSEPFVDLIVLRFPQPPPLHACLRLLHLLLGCCLTWSASCWEKRSKRQLQRTHLFNTLLMYTSDPAIFATRTKIYTLLILRRVKHMCHLAMAFLTDNASSTSIHCCKNPNKTCP